MENSTSDLVPVSEKDLTRFSFNCTGRIDYRVRYDPILREVLTRLFWQDQGKQSSPQRLGVRRAVQETLGLGSEE